MSHAGTVCFREEFCVCILGNTQGGGCYTCLSFVSVSVGVAQVFGACVGPSQPAVPHLESRFCFRSLEVPDTRQSTCSDQSSSLANRVLRSSELLFRMMAGAVSLCFNPIHLLGLRFLCCCCRLVDASCTTVSRSPLERAVSNPKGHVDHYVHFGSRRSCRCR